MITIYLPDVETDAQVVKKVAYVTNRKASKLTPKACSGGFTIRDQRGSLGRYTRRTKRFTFTMYGYGQIYHSRIKMA